MTLDPIIVSVPHCGTRFLKERLDVKDHVHTTESWPDLVERIRGRKLFVPLRKPDSVWRSWCRRADKRNFPYAEYYLAWATLQMVANQFEVDVICVDKKQDPRLDDWRAVGDEDASRAGWELIKIDQRPLYKLPLVLDNYGH
jgi:hypothetical protein